MVVALRKESVDRNPKQPNPNTCQHVALRKESVDRNNGAPMRGAYWARRSPQGERG